MIYFHSFPYQAFFSNPLKNDQVAEEFATRVATFLNAHRGHKAANNRENRRGHQMVRVIVAFIYVWKTCSGRERLRTGVTYNSERRCGFFKVCHISVKMLLNPLYTYTHVCKYFVDVVIILLVPLL